MHTHINTHFKKSKEPTKQPIEPAGRPASQTNSNSNHSNSVWPSLLSSASTKLPWTRGLFLALGFPWYHFPLITTTEVSDPASLLICLNFQPMLHLDNPWLAPFTNNFLINNNSDRQVVFSWALHHRGTTAEKALSYTQRSTTCQTVE